MAPVVIPDLQPEVENGFPLKFKTAKESSPAQGSDYVPLITKMKQRIEAGDNWFSMEFFPPRTKDGATNLLHKFEAMGAGGPLFCDITWHPAGNPGSEEATSCVTIADAMLNYIGIETMLHMTCCNMSTGEIKNHLDRIKSKGVFPGREIVQPTVVDPLSFRVWKDEAFALWLEKWARLYEVDDASSQILHQIHDSHLLVNLVDNNFPAENCLFQL